MTTMRFGLFIPQGWRQDLAGIDPAEQWDTMSRLARRADSGPWESIWVYDHFHTVPVPTDEPTHEAWALMAAFAVATERVRLGQMCTCVGYRNPTYLAKVAATIDHISGGRLEMSIGAGWHEQEWRAYGYGYPRDGQRLAMLDEGVQIMRQAWRTGTATLDGQHYQVDGAICRPLPLQAGGPPLWIAGGGEKVTLKIAARYAQYTNFDGNPEAFARKSQILREHCRAAGTDFDAITRTADFNVLIGEDQAEVDERRAWLREKFTLLFDSNIAAAELRNFDAQPAAVGTVEQVIEKLAELRDLGMTYPIFYLPDLAYSTRSLELLETKVIPALR